MRDPERISRILSLISFIWHKYPDLRFGQLLYVFSNFSENIFYYEDDKIEEELKRWIDADLRV